MTVIAQDASFKIERHGDNLYVNGSRIGIIVTLPNASSQVLVCHRRKIEKHSREFGFFIPKALKNLAITFEVRLSSGKFAHYHYRPAMHQRLIDAHPLLFISMARLIANLDATHVVRPRSTL